MSILISCMITPAQATFEDAYAWVKSSFIEWLHNSYTSGYGEGDNLLHQLFKPEDGECNHVWVYNVDDYKYCERCELGFEEYYNSKYNQYVTDLNTDFGTTTINSDGSLRLYFSFRDLPWTFESESSYFDVLTESGGVAPATSFIVDNVGNYSYYVKLSSWNSDLSRKIEVTAPVTGYYVRRIEWFSNNLYPYSGNRNFDNEPITIAQGNQISAEDFTWYVDKNISGVITTLRAKSWVDLYPATESDFTTQDISINSRPSSITGDYGILGDDGTMIAVDKTIVDEGHSIVYNPVTNTTYNYTDYAYDYSDRSYNLTLEDGSTMKVVYGDENITIQEGDTIYNVYYLTSGSEGGSGSGGSGDDGSGGIGGAIGGLFDVLGEIIYGLIEGTINLATKALSALTGLLDLLKQFGESIISFFGGYTDFLGAVFPFLPEETFTILNLGLILMIAAAVFKKFL